MISGKKIMSLAKHGGLRAIMRISSSSSRSDVPWWAKVAGGNYVGHEISSSGDSQGLTPSLFQTGQVRSEGCSEDCVNQYNQ